MSAGFVACSPLALAARLRHPILAGDLLTHSGFIASNLLLQHLVVVLAPYLALPVRTDREEKIPAALPGSSDDRKAVRYRLLGVVISTAGRNPSSAQDSSLAFGMTSLVRPTGVMRPPLPGVYSRRGKNIDPGEIFKARLKRFPRCR